MQNITQNSSNTFKLGNSRLKLHPTWYVTDRQKTIVKNTEIIQTGIKFAQNADHNPEKTAKPKLSHVHVNLKSTPPLENTLNKDFS